MCNLHIVEHTGQIWRSNSTTEEVEKGNDGWKRHFFNTIFFFKSKYIFFLNSVFVKTVKIWIF